jgi:hypothetical protein
VGLVYDHRGFPGIITTRSGVDGVLQMISEPTLVVLPARTSQLRRMR